MRLIGSLLSKFSKFTFSSSLSVFFLLNKTYKYNLGISSLSKACTGNQDEMSESVSASSAVPSVLQSHTCFLPRIQTALWLVLIVTPSSGELQPTRLTTALMARVKVPARRKNALQTAIMENTAIY